MVGHLLLLSSARDSAWRGPGRALLILRGLVRGLPAMVVVRQTLCGGRDTALSYELTRRTQRLSSLKIVIPSKARDLGLCLCHHWSALQAETWVPRFARDDTHQAGLERYPSNRTFSQLLGSSALTIRWTRFLANPNTWPVV